MLHRQSLSLRQILLHSKTPGTVLYIPVLLVPLSNTIEKSQSGFLSSPYRLSLYVCR